MRETMVEMMTTPAPLQLPAIAGNWDEEMRFSEIERGVNCSKASDVNQLPMNPQPCTFLCAFALGAVGKGNPVESVRSGVVAARARYQEYLAVSESCFRSSVEHGSTGTLPLVRQYFKDPSFFAKDETSRGGAALKIPRLPSVPSSPPLRRPSRYGEPQAMIINSAHLMGGSSEPNGLRGFRRVHIEAGMPMDGVGETGLLVVEANICSDSEITELVTVNGDVGAELRATLAWLDPQTTALSAQQLQHDLDLHVTAPSGAKYTMWESGADDTVNVVERVIVPVESMESGVWSVVVSARGCLRMNSRIRWWSRRLSTAPSSA
ncbi:unnamed protein product [Ectocarpus sp. CCAP 1310/34]|nr:unnamed protein product [Ectocarpus sp. CCAP 1310/34]